MYTKYLVNNSKKNKSWLENQIGEVRVEGARGPGGQGARGPRGQGARGPGGLSCYSQGGWLLLLCLRVGPGSDGADTKNCLVLVEVFKLPLHRIGSI